jgi:hypothetical protein
VRVFRDAESSRYPGIVRKKARALGSTRAPTDKFGQ